MIIAIIILSIILVGVVWLMIFLGKKNALKIDDLEERQAMLIADNEILIHAVSQRNHAIKALEAVMKEKSKIKKEYKEHEDVIKKAVAAMDADTILSSINSMSNKP